MTQAARIGAGGGTGGRGENLDGCEGLQGHGHAWSLGGENHRRVRSGGDFDADAAAAVEQTGSRRGAVGGARHTCGGVIFQCDDLRVADR